MSASISLKAVYKDSAELDADIEKNLQHGRIFLAQKVEHAEERAACNLTLSLVGGGVTTISGEIVWQGPNGVGIQFEWDAETESSVRQLLEGGRADAGTDTGGSVHEKIRHLGPADQQKIARDGTQSERVALERRFGKAVWEHLLRNPRLTPHEVANIARNGALPRPLVGQIAGKPQWIANPEVRRALLSNPRCTGNVLLRVLKTLPSNELKLVPQQTAYPPAVRQAAKRLLGRR